MQTSISIRRAVAEDIDALIDINIRVWHTTYRGLIADEELDAMTADSLRCKWESTVGSTDLSDRFCFVAASAGSVVGYVVCGKNREEGSPFEWVMYAIYILPEYHGKGIGRQLFYEAIDEMQKLNVTSFMLYVLNGNLQARRFYESFKPDTQAEHIIEIGAKPYMTVGYGWSGLPS